MYWSQNCRLAVSRHLSVPKTWVAQVPCHWFRCILLQIGNQCGIRPKANVSHQQASMDNGRDHDPRPYTSAQKTSKKYIRGIVHDAGPRAGYPVQTGPRSLVPSRGWRNVADTFVRIYQDPSINSQGWHCGCPCDHTSRRLVH